MGSSLVIEDLERWGPDRTWSEIGQVDAEAYCRRLATTQYENFPVVSILLPKRLRQHFYNVYAFCRWADDLGDESGSTAQGVKLLAWWQSELDRCYLGEVSHPVFVALLPTIRQFDLQKSLFDDLIAAFVQDQSVTRYETFSQLEDYCRRSANPVGRIVLALCGRLNRENAVLSDRVCTGLQLANFWQDVARDYEIGRIYLPEEDRVRFRVTDEMMEMRRTTPKFQALLRFEVARAREFLLAGQPLVGKMPGRLKFDIDLFVRGGLMILEAVERIDYQVWERRPVIRKSQFLWETVCSVPRVWLSR
ncbi:squalene synthase HpnC [Planctomicrobium sp. SH527]|uniref:squalene synthase HpnC n=1 Tax=Planctomicrobium sp. SH527 TaxID=3448123 RepID=UPI003F5C5895